MAVKIYRPKITDEIYGVPHWEWPWLSEEEKQIAKEKYEQRIKNLEKLCENLGVNSEVELVSELRKTLFGRDAEKYVSEHTCGNCANFSKSFPATSWLIELLMHYSKNRGKQKEFEKLLKKIENLPVSEKRKKLCEFAETHLKNIAMAFCSYLQERGFCSALKVKVEPQLLSCPKFVAKVNF